MQWPADPAFWSRGPIDVCGAVRVAAMGRASCVGVTVVPSGPVLSPGGARAMNACADHLSPRRSVAAALAMRADRYCGHWAVFILFCNGCS